MIESARVDLQYHNATQRCEGINNADRWRLRLEQEYEELKRTLQLWSQHKQSWYEAKTRELQEKWSALDRLQVRHRYLEVRFKLKVQRKSWRMLVESFHNPHFPLSA